MAPTRITARAYAKINLSLDVGPLRADGYHALASVMQTISLADDIEVELRRRGEVTLTCDAADIPNDERNTAVRAALSALRRWGPSAGAHIALTKRIPAQAGLGGGSSDAAVVLRAVARLLGRCPSDGEMTAAAAEIGSDVPFFVRGGTALVAGKGELVTPQGAAPRFPIVVAKPRAGVSTADAYRALDGCDESRPYPPGPRDRRRATPDVSEALAAADTERLLQAMGNHFELVIPQLVPPVASLMVAMRAAGARAVHLCGSGSAVFGVAESDEHARMMAVELATACPFVVVCEPVDAATATALEEKSVTPNSTQDERIPAIVMAGGTASAAFVAATGVPHRAMLSVPDPEWTGSPAPDLTMLDVAVRALTRSQRIAEVHVVTDLDAPKETNRIADHGGFVGNLFAGIEACADAQRACVWG
ncbi:MAG: 4-(cytidine 5'-diphospho)-2-C-methyl-D-erythritol kinase, partial [Armatimonadetes bacterium]|nr:4-(cytidine 5'-diphospho)-2-C-methyl-D-erythritol kinase [Armatimonadota bacterium]